VIPGCRALPVFFRGVENAPHLHGSSGADAEQRYGKANEMDVAANRDVLEYVSGTSYVGRRPILSGSLERPWAPQQLLAATFLQ